MFTAGCGLKILSNQEEQERRKREENSPEAIQERQQRAVDRASKGNAGSGFGSAGIQYDKSGRPYSRGGVVYAQEGRLMPGLGQYLQTNNQTMPEMTPTQGEMTWANRESKNKNANRDNSGALWHTDIGEISAYGPPAGPGLLAASFYERAGAAWNMLTDIGEARLAGAKGTRGQKFASVKPSSKPGLLTNILGRFKQQKKQSNNTDPISESPTFFHNSRAVFDRPDPNKANFGTYGPGFYGGTDAAEGYNRNYGDISYQFKIKGGVDDFPLANQKIGSSAHLERVSRIYEQLKIKPPSNLEDLTFSHFISDIGSKKINQIRDRGINSKLNRLLEPLGISLSDDLSPKQKNRITQQIRKSLVENNIPGLMNTRDMSGNVIPTNLQQMAVYDYDRILFDQPDPKQAVSKNKGGMIYANNGMLIPYQPRGTDTVPAMLTPGEFVVNRQATQQNLPLLQSINSGHMNTGGLVYLRGGGFAPAKAKNTGNNKYDSIMDGRAQAYNVMMENRAQAYAQRFNRQPDQSNQAAMSISKPENNTGPNLGQLFNGVAQSTNMFVNAINLATKTLEKYQTQVGSTPPNSVSNNTGSNNPNMDGLSQFTNTFNKFIGQLAALNLPPQITIQGTHKVEVVINGGAAFANMQEPIQRMILGEVNVAMNKLAIQTEGVLRT